MGDDPMRGLFSVSGALLFLLFSVLVLLMLFSLTLGRYPVPAAEVARIVLTTAPINAVGHYENAPWVVVEIVRMPRILLVTLCGMGLAMSGAAMQGVFRNPLIGPEIAGVSSGASLGGVAAIMLSWQSLEIVGLAFASGLAALAAAFALAQLSGRGSTLALVLSGVIIGGFCGSLVGLLQTLGETDARALGVDVNALRWALMGLVAVTVAAQVSVSGGVGWVGLIVPHLARMLVGPDHTRLLPASTLLGGVYLLAMDDIARSLTEQEIPIGLLTSAIGAPIFAFLFWKTQSKGWMRE
ncbi:molybdate ABC transporter permease MolB (plasmid) [Methylosinus sp. 3S-1]